MLFSHRSYATLQISTMILAFWMIPALLKQGSIHTTANPAAEINRNDIMGQCIPGSEVRDICERCSKSTKNDLAYLLCCNGSVRVRNYCQEFLNFDLHGKNKKKSRKPRDVKPIENLRNKLSNTWFKVVANSG